MTKFFLPYHILFVLLLVTGTLLANVRGEICTDDLGPCDDTCNSKCTARHPEGKGSCEVSVGSQICKCFYQCGAPSPPNPPKRKQCNVGIGPCSAACDEKCCDENCAAKFPGAMDGHGVCDELGLYRNCLCTYYC